MKKQTREDLERALEKEKGKMEKLTASAVIAGIISNNGSEKTVSKQDVSFVQDMETGEGKYIVENRYEEVKPTLSERAGKVVADKVLMPFIERQQARHEKKYEAIKEQIDKIDGSGANISDSEMDK